MTLDAAKRTRRRLEEVNLPAIDARIRQGGIERFLRVFFRAWQERERDVTRVVNANTTVPTVEVDTADGPAFAANWQDFAAHQPMQFWRLPWNDVICNGMFDRSPRTPASPETVFTIPEGFRPIAELQLYAVEQIAVPVLHRIDVTPAGLFQWNGAVAFAAGLAFQGIWRAVP